MQPKNFKSLNESARQVISRHIQQPLNEQVGQADQWGWQHLADVVSNWGQSVGHGEVWDSPPYDGISDINDILWLLAHWGEDIGQSLEQQTQTQPTVSARPQQRPQQKPQSSPFERRGR